MKLTALLILLSFFQLRARSIAQTVTFSGKDVPLQKVFSAVEMQTGYFFFYNETLLKGSHPVTLEVANIPLESFLSLLFNDLPLKYSIKKKAIIISGKLVAPVDQVSTPPGITVSGVVYDEKTGMPVSGANVVVNTSGKATKTDEKGMFVLNGIGENAQITISCIGYEKTTLITGKKDAFHTVLMRIAISELDQAVVQGYGLTSKRLATGNIVKISGEEIRKQPVMNPLMALQGRVPGMIVTPTSGNASSPVKVEIRGRNALNPEFFSEPLYVIDGVPQTVLNVKGAPNYNQGVSSGFIQGGISATKGQSPLFSLNPDDIESIEVLMDGDATAIYGSRAANGVILITTKRARPGKTNFNLRIEQGIVMAPRYPKMLTTQEYLAMRREAFTNDGIIPTAANAPDLTVWDTTRNTDWIRDVLGTGKNTAVSAGLSGGDNKTSFSISSNYVKQVDLFNRSGSNQRATLNIALSHHSPNQKLSVNLKANYGFTKVDAMNDNKSAFTLPPNAPPIYNAKGALNYDDWNAVGMGSQYPFVYLLSPAIAKTNSLTSGLSINYELLKGLTLSADAGYTNMQNTNDFFSPIAAQNPARSPLGSATFGRTRNNSWILEPQLRYTRFIGLGSLTVQVGGSLQTVYTSGLTITASGYTNDELLRSISSAPSQMASEGYSEYKYAAVFARINYNWDSKYILNINARRDGSSRFAPGRQFGNFGSIGASWIASEERWLKDRLPSWFNFIKLRGSYGLTGGDNIGDYQYLSQWSAKQPGNFAPMFKYNGLQPYVPIHAVNQQYHWEEVRNIEGALNLGFLKERANLTLAWYRKRSGNQLTELPTPIYTGFPSVVANWVATVQNSGLDVTLNAMLIKKKDLSLSLSFNLNNNKNKLIAYPGIESSPYATRYKVGQSLDMKYLLKYVGVDPATGLYSFEDYNKDGKVFKNISVVPGTFDDDRFIAINLAPKYAGGFGTDLRYKDFAFSLYFDFINKMGTHPYLSVTPGKMSNLVLPEEVVNNHWRKPGDKADYARYTSTFLSNNISDSDRAYMDASFIRLNNIALSYSLPEKLVKKAAMQSCSFSITAQNVFTITRYKMDPEIQNMSFNPIPRVITGTLSFNF